MIEDKSGIYVELKGLHHGKEGGGGGGGEARVRIVTRFDLKPSRGKLQGIAVFIQWIG